MPPPISATDFKHRKHPPADPSTCLLEPHPGFGLHKASPRVVLLEHRNVRHKLDFRWCAFGCQVEHTLKRSQRAIDGRVSYPCFLAAGDVTFAQVRGDVGSCQVTEEWLQMFDPAILEVLD